MERETFERALHSWPDWHDSIEHSRKYLGFNVRWPINIRRGLIKKRYPEIREQAEAELKRLDLPLNLREYWEDCFYSDYRNKEGKSDYRKITRCLSKRKSLPQLPFESSIIWYEEEDINDPWWRAEIRFDFRFATKEIFDHAARLAYAAVESSKITSTIREHPVCQWIKGGRPPFDASTALECVRLADEEGWTEREVGEKFGWAFQEDYYGELTQCRTARRYIKRGREIKQILRT